MTINVDTAKKNEVTSFLAKNGFTMSDAIRFYLDIMTSNPEMRDKLIEMMEDAEDIKAAEDVIAEREAGIETKTYTLDEVKKNLGL